MISDLNYILLADVIKKICNDSSALDYYNTIALKNVYGQIVSDLGNETGIAVDTNIEITDPTKGLVLQTDDGTRVLITVIKDINGDIRLNPVII